MRAVFAVIFITWTLDFLFDIEIVKAFIVYVLLLYDDQHKSTPTVFLSFKESVKYISAFIQPFL